MGRVYEIRNQAVRTSRRLTKPHQEENRLGRVVSRNGDAFGYNPRSEVVAASIATNAYSYSYDSIGNSLHSAWNAATNLYTANARNQYAAILSDSEPPCEPTYDADGNLLTWNGYNLVWDPDNRLDHGWRDGSDFGFIRDWSGRASCETDGADYTDRVFDGWNPVFERTFDGWTEEPVSDTVYVWGTDLSGTMRDAGGVGGLLAVKRDGVWYAPLYDANGNITAYVSEVGVVVAEYEYDAFGATISQLGTLADSFRHRFSTKPWIAALGAYDYGERLYSPNLRRWLSRDPIGEDGGVNLYAMCGNDLANAIDPYGRSVFFVGDPNQDYRSNKLYIPIAGISRISFSVKWEYYSFDCCGKQIATDSFGPLFYVNLRMDSYYPLWNERLLDPTKRVTNGMFGNNPIPTEFKGYVKITMTWSKDLSGVNRSKFRYCEDNSWDEQGEAWNLGWHYPWTDDAFAPFDKEGGVKRGAENDSGTIRVRIEWDNCDKEGVFKISGTDGDKTMPISRKLRRKE